MAATQAVPQAAHHEHTVRRLETFSDIVIAFTLSQLAFTLHVPQSSRDVFTHPVHLITFLGSFAFVCGLWWLHHRLFARYFYPDTPSVLLNFALLASTVFVVYSLLLLSTFDDSIALGAYGLSLGCAFGLISVLFTKGLRDPRIVLDADERETGSQTALRVGIGATGFLISAALALLGRSPNEVLGVWLAAGVVVIALRVRQRFVRRTLEPEQSGPGAP